MTETEEPWCKVGRCKLCGQEMLLTSDDCWHPYTVEKACPPEPNTTGSEAGYDREGWQKFFADGLRTGRPGRQHWRKLKCSDISNEDFLMAIWRNRIHISPISKELRVGWVLWPEVELTLREKYQDVPWRLVIAKARKLILKGYIDGCYCGCRGDFEILPKGFAVIAEKVNDLQEIDNINQRHGYAFED